MGRSLQRYFQSLGASAERASEFFSNRFAAIAGSHSQEVARQLEDRFRRDFAALVDVVGLVEGNTGLAGAIDRARFLIRDLGIEVRGALTFDLAIERARELIAALEVDETTAGKIREITQLLVDIPLQISGAIRGTIRRVTQLGRVINTDFTAQTEGANQG